MKSKQKVVQEVMDKVNWKQMEDIYSYLQWSWWDGYPEGDRLKDTARDLLEEVYEKEILEGDRTFTESGGLRAVKEDCGDMEVLRLHFKAISEFAVID